MFVFRSLQRANRPLGTHLFQRKFSSSPVPPLTTPPKSSWLRLGSMAPNFQANTTDGPIDFHKWIGNSWALLFSHPADFTPVCTTEMAELERNIDEFTSRNVKVIGLSCDTVETHREWVSHVLQCAKANNLDYPIIADPDGAIATLYNMIDEMESSKTKLVTCRSVFFIDPNKRIRAMLSYPHTTGRNFPEILRAIDSLQVTDLFDVVTPVNWLPGQDVIIHPKVSDEDAKLQFPEHVHVLPYLRTTSLEGLKAAKVPPPGKEKEKK